MVFFVGSSFPQSVASLGSNRFMRNGRVYPIKTQAAACNPGVLKNISANNPAAKLMKSKAVLLIFEWQPEDEYKIKIRYDKLMQRRDLAQHKNLDEHDKYEPDDIFKE